MLADVWLLLQPCWAEMPAGRSRMHPPGSSSAVGHPLIAVSHLPPGFGVGGMAEIRAAWRTSCPTSQPAGNGMGVPLPPPPRHPPSLCPHPLALGAAIPSDTHTKAAATSPPPCPWHNLHPNWHLMDTSCSLAQPGTIKMLCPPCSQKAGEKKKNQNTNPYNKSLKGKILLLICGLAPASSVLAGGQACRGPRLLLRERPGADES